MRNIGEAIDHLLKKYNLQERIAAQPVFDAFMESIGREHRSLVQPVKFSRNTLEVTVGSATLLHELQHFKNDIILENIRKTVPHIKVQKIKYRQG
jgi:hypothetical protein